jgi:hypothetical protein
MKAKVFFYFELCPCKGKNTAAQFVDAIEVAAEKANYPIDGTKDGGGVAESLRISERFVLGLDAAAEKANYPIDGTKDVGEIVGNLHISDYQAGTAKYKAMLAVHSPDSIEFELGSAYTIDMQEGMMRVSIKGQDVRLASGEHRTCEVDVAEINA